MGEETHNAESAAAREVMREHFLDLISAYSEDMWCAGWMSGIEQEIRRQQGVWLPMAVACGGWPKGYRAEDGWDPLTDEERAAWAQFDG